MYFINLIGIILKMQKQISLLQFKLVLAYTIFIVGISVVNKIINLNVNVMLLLKTNKTNFCNVFL